MTTIRRAARLAGGYALIFFGVIGLFLPVLQGTLMILAGAALLGWNLKRLAPLRDRLSSRCRALLGRIRMRWGGQ